MSDSTESPIFWADDSDPEMKQAYEQARANFRYFWRELTWEQRRIIPGLSLSCVKAPFRDPGSGDDSRVEQMWMNDVLFDGKIITGTLVNSPNWLKTYSEGDEIQLPIEGITDWMYAIGDRVYGAYTVNQMRSQMPPEERAAHDDAWGLDFGDPNEVLPIPPREDGTIDLDADHPMSMNITEAYDEQISQDPNLVHWKDDDGWTLLHQLSLGGSSSCVPVLLKHGADPNVMTNHGMTPLQLANVLGWSQVADLLTANGAS